MYQHKYLKYKQKYLDKKKKIQANMVGGVLTHNKCDDVFRQACHAVKTCVDNNSFFMVNGARQCTASTVFTQPDLDTIITTLINKVLPCIKVNGQNLNNIGQNITAMNAGSFSLILNIDDLVVRVSKLIDNETKSFCKREIVALEKIKSVQDFRRMYINEYYGFMTTARDFRQNDIGFGNIQSVHLPNNSDLQVSLENANKLVTFDFQQFVNSMTAADIFSDNLLFTFMEKAIDASNNINNTNVHSEQLLNEIADALFLLHSHGIFHNDIKPENVVMSRNNQFQLIDFGLCNNNMDINNTYVLNKKKLIGDPLFFNDTVFREQRSVLYDWYCLYLMVLHTMQITQINNGVFKFVNKLKKKYFFGKQKDKHTMSIDGDLYKLVGQYCSPVDGGKFVLDPNKYPQNVYETCK